MLFNSAGMRCRGALLVQGCWWMPLNWHDYRGKLWCDLDVDHFEGQNSRVSDKYMEIAYSVRFAGPLPHSLISGPNEFSEQSQRWEDRLFQKETWGKNCCKQAWDVASTNISIPLSIPSYISKTCPPSSLEQGHFHHYKLSYSLLKGLWGLKACICL